MDLEGSIGQMVTLMLANSKMENVMVLEKESIQMGALSMDIMKMINLLVMEHINGLMANDMRDSGIMASFMV